jgi:hypothetical protein
MAIFSELYYNLLTESSSVNRAKDRLLEAKALLSLLDTIPNRVELKVAVVESGLLSFISLTESIMDPKVSTMKGSKKKKRKG